MDLQSVTSTLILHQLNTGLQSSNTDLKAEGFNSPGFTPPLQMMLTVFLRKFQLVLY